MSTSWKQERRLTVYFKDIAVGLLYKLLAQLQGSPFYLSSPNARYEQVSVLHTLMRQEVTEHKKVYAKERLKQMASLLFLHLIRIRAFHMLNAYDSITVAAAFFVMSAILSMVDCLSNIIGAD